MNAIIGGVAVLLYLLAGGGLAARLVRAGVSATGSKGGPLMLGWGAFISALLFLAMLPGFIGLFIVLPLFGHASWHLYRRAIAWPGDESAPVTPL